MNTSTPTGVTERGGRLSSMVKSYLVQHQTPDNNTVLGNMRTLKDAKKLAEEKYGEPGKGLKFKKIQS